MKQGFCMPKLGLTMTEGLLAEWSVKPGEQFVRGQCVYIVETDKAANEIAADEDGTLLEILHVPGATVPVGDLIGYWDDSRAATDPARAEAPSATPEPIAPSRHDGPTPPPAGPAPSPTRIRATPLARRVAERQGLDLVGITGTGPRGRIKLSDLSAARSGEGSDPKNMIEGVERVKPGAAHAAMARRLAAAKQEVPHFYLASEADVGRLIALRAELGAGSGPRFTLNHFVVAAVGRALHDEPLANRVWADGALLQFKSPDVGVAVSTERGLYVPVLRDAGRLSLSLLAQQLQALIDRARKGGLGEAQMSGGAITVSNAGMFNVTYMTPIINPGQAMILGVGSVRSVFRPDDQGQPLLRREMGLVLACDHRVMDGVAGLRFLNRVVRYLEKPLQLLAGP